MDAQLGRFPDNPFQGLGLEKRSVEPDPDPAWNRRRFFEQTRPRLLAADIFDPGPILGPLFIKKPDLVVGLEPEHAAQMVMLGAF